MEQVKPTLSSLGIPAYTILFLVRNIGKGINVIASIAAVTTTNSNDDEIKSNIFPF
jgi:hypothetical protein